MSEFVSLILKDVVLIQEPVSLIIELLIELLIHPCIVTLDVLREVQHLDLILNGHCTVAACHAILVVRYPLSHRLILIESAQMMHL